MYLSCIHIRLRIYVKSSEFCQKTFPTFELVYIAKHDEGKSMNEHDNKVYEYSKCDYTYSSIRGLSAVESNKPPIRTYLAATAYELEGRKESDASWKQRKKSTKLFYQYVFINQLRTDGIVHVHLRLCVLTCC